MSISFHILKRLLVARIKKSCISRSIGLLRSSTASGGSDGADWRRRWRRRREDTRYFGLPARLRKARKQSGLTRKGGVKTVGGDQSVVRDIETNQRLPTVGTVARLASALHVSAAWLAFGLGDPELDGLTATCEGMGSRLEAVRCERGLTKAALARLVKVTPRTVAVIESGGQAKVQTVESLAQALGVSPAWLAFNQGPSVLPRTRRTRPAPESSTLGC